MDEQRREQFVSWVLETMVSQLIIRMDLSRTRYGGPGAEQVRSGIIGYHYDDDGPVMANISYDCFEGSSVGHVECVVEADPKKFADMAKGAASLWDSEENWVQQTGKLVRYKAISRPGGTRAFWESLAPSNLLALQHLARVQGALGQYHYGAPGCDERAVVTSTVRRIGDVIRNGNNEIERLTRLS